MPSSRLPLAEELTMPAVTVLFSWNGLPIAITHSPGRTVEELPKGNAGKPVCL